MSIQKKNIILAYSEFGLHMFHCIKTIKNTYQIQCARRISEITLIRYAQHRKIGKPNNLKKSLKIPKGQS